MAIVSGFYDSFANNTIEYVRAKFNIEKNKYYKPSRTSLLFLAGFGEIPGGQVTQDQKKVKIALKSRVEDQMQFEIITHDARVSQQTTFVTGLLPTGTRGSTSVYTVDDASILRPYDIIKNMTTNEYLLITAVDTSQTPDQITAYPAFSQTGFAGLTAFPWTLSNAAAQAKTNADVIRVVGVAFPQGSTSSDLIDTRPVTAVNYMQVFREDFGEKFEEAQTKKNGRMNIEDKEERAKANVLIKLEKAMIEGGINSQSVVVGSATDTITSMQGIKGQISTYAQAITALVGAGTEWSIPKVEQVLSQISGANVSGKATGFCGENFLRKFRELCENKVEMPVAVGTEDFGIKPMRYTSTFLPVDFVRHDIFDATGNSDEVMFVDLAMYELVSLRNSEMALLSSRKGLPYGGLADNARARIQDAHHGVYSLDYRFEESAALVTGATYSIAS